MNKLLLCLLSLTILVGCGTKVSKEETAMKELTDAYYEAHLIGSEDAKEVTISILDFKLINELEPLYDLKDVEHCSDETSITIKIDNVNKKITDYTFDLKCD